MNIIVEGGRLVDPASGREGPGVLWIAAGRLVAPGSFSRSSARVLDASGLAVGPGLMDLHVHLREPGNDAAETIETGTRAAAAGGFTSVVTMPNTRPPVDTPAAVRFQIRRARDAGFCAALPSACLTVGREGAEVAPLERLADAGAVVFTDDGSTVADDAVLREAMRRARMLNRTVMDHAQDPAAEQRGCMHEGEVSRRLGLPGIASSAEERIIRRDIALARETGCALHIQHLSSREGVELVRAARAEGLPVSAELTPHHLALSDADLPGPDPLWKMNPPLRSPRDREALIRAIGEGVLTCFATDHAPHTAEAKARGMRDAPFGIVGLETAVGVTMTELVRPGRLRLVDWWRAWTTGPAEVLRLPAPSLEAGAPADLTLIDPETPWVVDPARFLSKSRNTPFAGRTLYGRTVVTLRGGRVVWDARASAG